MTGLVTLDDREAVYVLLRHLNAWVPPPRTARPAQAGFVHGPRTQACPDCLTNDRVSRDCETCHGAGEVMATGRDPYERKAGSFFGDDRVRQLELARQRDATLARLERDWGAQRGSLSTDPLAVAADKATTHYAHGFRPLLRALATVEAAQPHRVRGLRRLIVNGEEELVQLPPWTRVWLDETVDWVAALMPQPIQLPAELAPDLDAWRHCLQHGKTEQHRRLRAARAAQLVMLRAEHGWSLRRLGQSFGLSPEGVRKILDEAVPPAA